MVAMARDALDMAVEECLVATGRISRRDAERLKNEHHVDVSTVRRHAATVLLQLGDEMDPATLPGRKARGAARFQRVAALAERREDFDAAIAALDKAAKIEGLYAPQQIEVKGTLAVVVEDMNAIARGILAAVPDACALLGVPCPELALPGPGVVDVACEEVARG